MTDLKITYLANISHYVPELLALALMMGLVLVEATYGRKEKTRKTGFFVAIFGLIFIIASLFQGLHNPPQEVFTHSVVIDPFSTFIKILMTIGTLICLMLTQSSKDIVEDQKNEYGIMVVGVLLGGMLLASASNMITLYLGIETLSILSYALASFKRNDQLSSEAGLKYALYGGVSSGLMLFGMSHIYGVTGSIYYHEISGQLVNLTATELAIMLPAILMFFAGIGYKLAAVPFHMWSPDVYEGSPIPVTAFFALVPKAAAVAALVRFTSIIGVNATMVSIGWHGVLIVIAALTMCVGNITAIGQRSVKRMLAYSSIAHSGTIMLGALCLDGIGLNAILFYLTTYLFMTLVAFFCVSLVADHYGNDHFERFSGLIQKHPLMAVALTLAMLSLAGIPPLSGFVAKFNIINAILAKKYYMLAIITGLNSVISLYYYMKIVRLMMLKMPDDQREVSGFNFTNQATIVLLSIPILVLGIFWDNLYTFINTGKLLNY